MKRALLLLLLGTSCRSPTAPETPECTISTAFVRLCYRPCPPNAEAHAAALWLTYAPEYLCT